MPALWDRPHQTSIATILSLPGISLWLQFKGDLNTYGDSTVALTVLLPGYRPVCFRPGLLPAAYQFLVRPGLPKVLAAEQSTIDRPLATADPANFGTTRLRAGP